MDSQAEAAKMTQYIRKNLTSLINLLPDPLTVVLVHLYGDGAISRNEKNLIDGTPDRNDQCFKLFDILGKNYPENYKILLKVLEDPEIDAKGAAKILKDFNCPEVVGSVANASSNSGTKLQNFDALSDKEIHKISHKLSLDPLAINSYAPICNSLGLNFDVMFPNKLLLQPYEIFHKILLYWKGSKPDEASLENLQLILESLGLKAISNKILECK